MLVDIGTSATECLSIAWKWLADGNGEWTLDEGSRLFLPSLTIPYVQGSKKYYLRTSDYSTLRGCTLDSIHLYVHLHISVYIHLDTYAHTYAHL